MRMCPVKSMPCEEYNRLEHIYKYNWDQANYFRFNKEMAGVSETVRKKLIKDHTAKSTEASQAKSSHRQYCEECKKDKDCD